MDSIDGDTKWKVFLPDVEDNEESPESGQSEVAVVHGDLLNLNNYTMLLALDRIHRIVLEDDVTTASSYDMSRYPENAALISLLHTGKPLPSVVHLLMQKDRRKEFAAWLIVILQSIDKYSADWKETIEKLKRIKDSNSRMSIDIPTKNKDDSSHPALQTDPKPNDSGRSSGSRSSRNDSSSKLYDHFDDVEDPEDYRKFTEMTSGRDERTKSTSVEKEEKESSHTTEKIVDEKGASNGRLSGKNDHEDPNNNDSGRSSGTRSSGNDSGSKLYDHFDAVEDPLNMMEKKLKEYESFANRHKNDADYGTKLAGTSTFVRSENKGLDKDMILAEKYIEIEKMKKMIEELSDANQCLQQRVKEGQYKLEAQTKEYRDMKCKHGSLYDGIKQRIHELIKANEFLRKESTENVAIQHELRRQLECKDIELQRLRVEHEDSKMKCAAELKRFQALFVELKNEQRNSEAQHVEIENLRCDKRNLLIRVETLENTVTRMESIKDKLRQAKMQWRCVIDEKDAEIQHWKEHSECIRRLYEKNRQMTAAVHSVIDCHEYERRLLCDTDRRRKKKREQNREMADHDETQYRGKQRGNRLRECMTIGFDKPYSSPRARRQLDSRSRSCERDNATTFPMSNDLKKGRRRATGGISECTNGEPMSPDTREMYLHTLNVQECLHEDSMKRH